MNHTILPADIYTVLSKSVVSNLDRRIITLLYQPIIGYTAVSLYFTLLDDLDKLVASEVYTHHHLMSMMQLKLDSIVKAREKLEAIGLIKTYLKKDSVNNYVYLVYAPLSAQEFLTHPVLSIVLYNNLGKTEYDNVVKYFKIPRINLKEYEDITIPFSSCFTSVSGSSYIMENDTVLGRNTNALQIESQIDINLLIESIPKNMVNDKCFSKEVIELLQNLAFIYRLEVEELSAIIRNNLNDKGMIDKLELRKACRNYYQFENNDRLPTVIYKTQPEYLRNPKGDTSKRARLIYTFETTSPYDFLASKYKTGEPSTRDMRLIEELMIDFHLNPGVVNVLLAYVLHINNKKLNKSYIETIAGQWQRLEIETVEEALSLTEKEYKKKRKDQPVKRTKECQQTSKETLPIWFDKEISEELGTVDEQKEMEKLLKEMC